MQMPELGQRIAINDEPVILIADEVAPVSQLGDDAIMVETGTSQHEFVWCREADVAAARELDPEAAIYGIWQTVLRSGLLDAKKRLQLIYLRGGGGLYGLIEKGRLVETGPFENDQIFSAHEVPPIEEGVRLNERLVGVLKTPDKAIKTPQERERARTSMRRNLLITGGAACVAIAVAAGGADFWLAKRAADFQDQTTAANRQARALESELSSMNLRVSPITEADIVKWKSTVSRLAEIVNASNVAVIEGIFGTQRWEVEASSVPRDISFEVEASAYPGSSLKYSFNTWEIDK